MNIFVSKNGKQHGPFNADQVRHELKIGAFLASDYAWHEGLTEWVPLHSIFSRPVPARRVAKDRTMAPIIIALLILFVGAFVGYYHLAFPEPKMSDACKRYLDLYPIDAMTPEVRHFITEVLRVR